VSNYNASLKPTIYQSSGFLQLQFKGFSFRDQDTKPILSQQKNHPQ